MSGQFIIVNVEYTSRGNFNLLWVLDLQNDTCTNAQTIMIINKSKKSKWLPLKGQTVVKV